MFEEEAKATAKAADLAAEAQVSRAETERVAAQAEQHAKEGEVLQQLQGLIALQRLAGIGPAAPHVAAAVALRHGAHVSPGFASSGINAGGLGGETGGGGGWRERRGCQGCPGCPGCPGCQDLEGLGWLGGCPGLAG